MKFYNQLMLEGKPLFDVVWGFPMEEDNTLAIAKVNAGWIILDIASGTSAVSFFKTKKEALAWYQAQNVDHTFDRRLLHARSLDFYTRRVERMNAHKILHSGDRCTYIDVKDSVILTLIDYLPKNDTWIVEDEWRQFEISPDRIIKVSEVK